MEFVLDGAFAGQTAYAYTGPGSDAGSRAHDPARPAIVFIHGAQHDHSVWAAQSSWFLAQGWADLTEPLRDPVWGASWDFDAEAELAARLR